MRLYFIFIRFCLSFLFIFIRLLLSPTWAANFTFDNTDEFSLRELTGGGYEITDGIGRILYLIPHGIEIPPDIPRYEVIPIPVRRVVMTGSSDISILLALNSIEVLVGVDGKIMDWKIPQICEGIRKGSIINFSDGYSLDYERLAALKPDVVFTWDERQISFLASLGIPVVINCSSKARTLNKQISYIYLLASFLDKQEVAKAYITKIKGALEIVQQRTKDVVRRPKVFWGDFWGNRALVEPGQSWVAQLVDMAGGDYLFKNTSRLEISFENFYSAAKQADIMFTYRSLNTSMVSNKVMLDAIPILGTIKPIQEGKVYFALPEYNQSGHCIDKIIKEIAAILHPTLFPDSKITLFLELSKK